jgi:hypothetical protein
MTTTKATGPVTVLETGFKMIPAKETDFLAFQGKMVPVAMEQDGFGAVYGGPILDSTWVYFGVRFDSAEQMDARHHHPQHQAAQKSAYARWWTSVNVRKWRSPTTGEALGVRLMSETRLFVDTALNDAQMNRARQALGELSAAGAVPFEPALENSSSNLASLLAPSRSLRGPRKWPIRWLRIGLQRIISTHGKHPVRITHCKCVGEVSSELFVAMKETLLRDSMRDGKLQREWTLDGHR